MLKLLTSIKIFFILFLFSCCETSINSNYYKADILLDSYNFDESRNLETSNSELLSFLALGDSYTIGEGVDIDDRWPNQFIEYALDNGIYFDTPEIIAETGWKSYDLISAIKSSRLDKKYDYISLLIGVNNQFNSIPIVEFENDLNKILLEINYLKKGNSKIIIISIPDWGYSPFGENFDRNRISSEINAYNGILKKFANINNFKFVDITEISRKGISEPSLIANDNLHPSGLMYHEWVKKIFQIWIN